MSTTERLVRSHPMIIEPVYAGSTTEAGQFDDISRAWVDGLQASGATHDRCVAQLHALLLRVARHEARRKATAFRLDGQELDDIVNQVADDALMAIKAKVGEFRGESRFTTWAYRFVVYEVSTKIGAALLAQPPGCSRRRRLGSDSGRVGRLATPRYRTT